MKINLTNLLTYLTIIKASHLGKVGKVSHPGKIGKVGLAYTDLPDLNK